MLFDDLIVINDGSEDETKSRINELKLTKKFTAIHLPEPEIERPLLEVAADADDAESKGVTRGQ